MVVVKKCLQLNCIWLLGFLVSFNFGYAERKVGKNEYVAERFLMNEADAFAYEYFFQDTVILSEADSLRIVLELNTPYRRLGITDTLNLDLVESSPFISLQQNLKGLDPGVYVQEPSGEPGTIQNMYLRGVSSPLIDEMSVVNAQPQVYLNGIPLIAEHPFAYDVQQYKTNRIGTASNTLAGLNLNDIASIEVVKDPATLAKLGPLASKGAVYITTQNAKASARDVSFNMYTGFVSRPSISPVNAYYESLFRAPFYAKYASLNDELKYPSFLADSTNLSYFGPSDWHERYYQTAPIYSADVSLVGGSPRANFRFFAGHTSNAGNADDTKLGSYNAAFYINMAPFTWFNVSSMLHGSLLQRDRNRNFKDRFAEMRYLPNMSVPIPPSKSYYEQLLAEYEGSIDNNKNSLIRGNVSLNFSYENLRFTSGISVDYNEGVRDAFYPSTLLEGNNYTSNYFGYSQRVIASNVLSYEKRFDKDNLLNLELGNQLYFDMYRYNYTYGYRGPSDFIKVIVVEGNSGSSEYLQPRGVEVFRNTDTEKINMSSFYGNANYSFKDLKVSAALRADGASNIQPDARWNISGGLGADYQVIDEPTKTLSSLKVNGGWSKVSHFIADDRYAVGPQYKVDIGWGQAVNLPSYNGFPVVSRPYTQGWVGYGVDWPYSIRTELGLEAAFLQNRLFANAQFYLRDDKSQIVQHPIPQEYGYEFELLNGLDVRNLGVEFSLGGDVFKNDRDFTWFSRFNIGYNNNKLLALPKDRESMIIGDHKIEVGQRIDQFWLLEGKGAYVDMSQVPINPQTGERMSINGIALDAGDPKWVDQNNDYVISSADKVMKGQLLPSVVGGFYNQFTYKGFDLSIGLYFATGHNALNERAANVFNFINLENSNDLNSVKEIFSWQQDINIEKYPQYNVWSDSDPYQLNQDMFLEKLDFLKVRSLSLGYDLKNYFIKDNNPVFRRAYVYVSGNNLFTFSNFKGSDPELVTSLGRYDGYGHYIPRTFSLGLKLNL